MSNIPSTAVAAALVPVQQTANETMRARRVQSIKETHHSEEVEELDDTAVSNVSDEQEAKEKRERRQRKRSEGETVEIESLKEGFAHGMERAEDSISHLDISA